ncbi:MAG: DUF456 family protein [Phycisphaerales bacterium]
MFVLAASVMTLAALLGVMMACLTLPGAWLMLAAAVGCQFWQPGMFNWWTIGICAAVALAGEAAEFVATALGARRAGGGRAGAWGAVGGTLLGAIAGTFVPPPIIGTLVGAAIGAGVGALAAERRWGGKTWEQAATIGSGAAVGRLAATLVKVVIALAVGLTLTVAAWVR